MRLLLLFSSLLLSSQNNTVFTGLRKHAIRGDYPIGFPKVAMQEHLQHREFRKSVSGAHHTHAHSTHTRTHRAARETVSRHPGAEHPVQLSGRVAEGRGTRRERGNGGARNRTALLSRRDWPRVALRCSARWRYQGGEGRGPRMRTPAPPSQRAAYSRFTKN